MRQTWVVVIAIVACGFAWALPPLETYRGHGLELQVPRGWTVTVDEAAGSVFVVEDPGDRTSAGMALLVVPRSPGLDAAALTETVLADVPTPRTELGRQVAAGVVWTLQSFQLDGVAALLTSVAISHEGGDVASIAVFSARTEAFEALGGAALLFVTFAGADPARFAAPERTAGPGRAFPPLEPIAELGAGYRKPVGWQVVTERVPGQELIYLLEDPADDHGAMVLYLAQAADGLPPAGTDVVAGVIGLFTQALAIVDVEELRRSGDLLTGARLLSGTRLGRPTKAFFAIATTEEGAQVYGVVAQAERFDAFGGHGLAWITLGGMAVEDFVVNAELQSWYGPAASGAVDAGGDTLAAQQALLDLQSRWFTTWSNDLGGNTHCWSDGFACY